MNLSLFLLLLVLFGTVLAAAAAGIWFGGRPATAMRFIPLGGGVLAGVSLFWILPEVAGRFGWAEGVAAMSAGAALLYLVDRFLWPVCPACAHTHDHDACEMRLHGFAAPLAIAVGVHAFLDGVGVAAAHGAASGRLGQAVFWGLALHKIPEGLAMGVILRASVRSWPAALAWSVAAQTPMIAGGWIEAFFAPGLGAAGGVLLLAAAGGSFFFLGAHAVHVEFRRAGAGPAFVPAVLGFLVAAVLPHALSGH